MNSESDRLRDDFDAGLGLRLLRRMLVIRRFEERAAELVKAGVVKCPVHLCIGQEAIAAGVCENLTSSDYVFSTHRSHGHFLAQGGSPRALMAELYGKDTGASRGHGGSMHVCDPIVGFMGSSAIVAGTIPIAVGAALGAKLRGTKGVGVAFFGDGATDEGVFYESLNLAVLYRLPVLFVCENNAFSTHLPDFLRQSNPVVHERVSGFGIAAEQVDGNSAMDVCASARVFVERARGGHGPALLECTTFRWLAHVGSDEDIDVGYRRRDLIDSWKARCPINSLRDELSRRSAITDAEADQMDGEVRRVVDDAVGFAESSSYPRPESMSLGGV